MKNRSLFFLARKYLQGRKHRGINPTHYLTLIGISLGVLALLCVSSVMNGFRSDIRSRIVGTFAELRLSSRDGKPLDNYPALCKEIKALGYPAAPVIRNELLLKSGQVVLPTLSIGIELPSQQQVSTTLLPARNKFDPAAQGILAGKLETGSFNRNGIALGAGLASQLGVYPGDEIQVLSPLFSVPTAFGLIPKVRYLQVQAIFAAGMPEYDQSYSYLALPLAKFFAADSSGVDNLDIKVPQGLSSAKALRILKAKFPHYRVEDWSSYDTSLYSAMRFEKFIMFVIMLFMFIIASFNLTGNLLKILAQKKRELGLLKALGLDDRKLQRVFLLQALLLCTLGISLGLGLGSLLLIIQQQTGLVKLGMGESGSLILPVKLQFTDYLLIAFVSYLLTVLSVMVPLRRIKRINAVELLRRAV